MAISNGFDNTRVLQALGSRLGWRNGTASPYNIVATLNTISSSGRYFNDGSFYEGCTIEHLYDCGSKHADAAAFNTWLANKRNANVLAAVNTVFSAPQTVEHGLLFDKWYNSQLVPVPNEGKFVGIKLKVAEGDYTVQVNSLQLLFDGAATFTLYLYNDLVNQPLWSKEVTTQANTQVMTTDLLDGDEHDLLLSYISSHVKGGTYYLGYYQDDLGSVHALDYSYPQRHWYHCLSACSFEAAANDDTTAFSREHVSLSTKTYGLNLDMTVYRDYTEVIVRQPHLFDELLGLMMAVNVVELVQTGTRSNMQQRLAEDKMAQMSRDLNAETTAQYPFAPGLKSKIKRETERVRNAFFPKPQVTITTPQVCR